MLKNLLLTLLICTSPLLAANKKEDGKIQTLSKECSAFGLSLYTILNKPDPANLVFSPYSIFSCLSMVAIGAREDTETEMRQALHLSYNRNELPKAASTLAKYLTRSVNEAYTLDVANGLWLDQDTFVLADYRHALEEGYQANVQSLDFSKTAEAVSIINEWTDNQTKHKISRLLQPNDIDGATRMVLTNAVYFQGNWQKPFDPKKTQDASFYPEPESTVQVKMMEQTSNFLFLENDSLQIVALPFTKKEEKSSLAYVILLPKKESSLDDLEKMLSETTLSGWIDQLSNERVRIKMPKFCLERRTPLNQPLQDLGIQKAYTDKANFSGINGMQDLFLSKVVHATFFSIDEAGVVAAAATAASMNVTATPPSTPLRTFIADRPFIFLLIDLTTKLPLFIGKIQDPTYTTTCE